MIPLGILASQVAPDLGAFELISTTVLTASAASVTFSSIPQDYKHLQIRVTTRTTYDLAATFSQITFNADTGTNYSWHLLRGTGNAVSAFAGANQNYMQSFDTPGGTSPSGAFQGAVIDVLDAFATNKNTTLRTLSGSAGVFNQIQLSSGAWRNTSALTTIAIASDPRGLWSAGSRFSLYGIKG